MSNVQSYNALIDRFKAFAAGHFILKRFSHGQIEVSDLEKFGEYPFMHVIPSNVTYSQGMKTFSFQIVLADLPRDKEDKSEYQREVLSDLQRIAEDLIAEITNHRVLFGDLITVNNVSLEPFLEEFQHTLTGWTISLDLLVPYYWDACSIPAEWNDMFESSTGGTGSILTFTDSITRDENGFVRLVNDEAEPAPNYYYGTNDEGVRGWYLLTDEVGLTCVTLPSCQTIIDIEAAIDLLQTDVTDLQSDVSSLETNKVPYTGATGNVDLGEYELKAGQIELDQTPTGTAGVGVMRWNDTDGTVDIGLKGGNVTLQVGQEEVVRVVNKTGGTLNESAYQAVRVRSVSEGGAQGQRLAVVLAQANNDANSATTIGIVTETISNNQEGFITTNGNVNNINTTGSLQGETWVDGDILYLSGTTAGQLTNVKPSAPTHTIIVGYVVYAHANNGKIFVKVDNGYELDELHNVAITSPANNEVLTYESSTSLWKNETITSALGFTPVPETRTLTINGTTQDLSANRTFTIATGLTVGTTPITSGTVGRVLFEGTGNVLQESANLFWDNTNNRLGIGTATPLVSTDIRTSSNSPITPLVNVPDSATTLLIGNTGTNGVLALGQNNTSQAWIQARSRLANASANVLLLNPLGGNVLIGTTTDAGYKLDVNGTARVVSDSVVQGRFSIGTTSFVDGLRIARNPTSASSFSTFINVAIQNTVTSSYRGVATSIGLLTSGFTLPNLAHFECINDGTFTAGVVTNLYGFRESMGTYNANNVYGFHGSVSAASNRWNIYMSGSALNYLNGSLLIGTTTDVASSKLTVTSTTQGFLPPRMTNAQRLAIASPAVGLIVYCTDAVEGLYVNKSTGWTFVI